MPYYLKYAKQVPHIMIVGCGGTGGFLAESICRLMTGRDANIVLVDHDIVEPHNLLRQNFKKEEVGRFKSNALAERLSSQFDRSIAYSTQKFIANDASVEVSSGMGYQSRSSVPDIIIGCVDNAEARTEIEKSVNPIRRNQWIIDAGNGKNWGQILVGNSNEEENLHSTFHDKEENQICYALPTPAMQRPDLLTFVPEEPPDVDCAAAMDLLDQDPTINQTMAALTLQVVRRIIAQNCPFMALYADMETGTVMPTYATPENVARITGIEQRLLMHDQEATSVFCQSCRMFH